MVAARTDDDKGTRAGNRPGTAAHEARPANGWFIPAYAVQ